MSIQFSNFQFLSIQGSVTTQLMVAIKTPKTKLFCKDFFFFFLNSELKENKKNLEKKQQQQQQQQQQQH